MEEEEYGSALALLDDELLEEQEAEDEELNTETFEFSDKQDEFIFATTRWGGYGGGVGNGKSFAGCVKAHRHCTEQDNAFFLIGRKNAVDLEDSTQRDFLELFEGEGTWSEKHRRFTYPNGSQVIFRHLEDLRKLTNMNLSGYWIDQAEEVDEQAFIFLNGRIRRKGKRTGKDDKGQDTFQIHRREGFITYNMEGHNWIYYRFHLKVDSKTKEPLLNGEDYHNIVAESMENKHLSQDYIDTIMSMPADWVKRFVHGSWDQFSGQIFSEFNPLIHVVAPFQIPNFWPRYRAIDHGQMHATTCVWGAADPMGNIFIYQEYWQEDAPVSDHVKEILRLSQVALSGGGFVMDEYDGTYIDPSTHMKNREKDGKKWSVADEYWEAGIMTMPAQNDVLAGITRVRQYLRIHPKRWHPQRTDPDGSPMQGAPRVYIFETCHHLIEELQQYKWKPPRYGQEQDLVEKPVKRNDDTVDAFRYLIMSRPQNPDAIQDIDPRVMSNPLEFARYLNDLGMSHEQFMSQRFGGPGGRNGITHTNTGIAHSESDISHSTSFPS